MLEGDEIMDGHASSSAENKTSQSSDNGEVSAFSKFARKFRFLDYLAYVILGFAIIVAVFRHH